jgi:hypothetical protein
MDSSEILVLKDVQAFEASGSQQKLCFGCVSMKRSGANTAWKASYRGGNFESGGVKVEANEYQFLGLVAIDSYSKQLGHLSNTFKEFERKFKNVKNYEPVWFFGGGKLDPAKVNSSLAPKAVKGWVGGSMRAFQRP